MEMREDRINGEEILTEILNIVGEDIALTILSNFGIRTSGNRLAELYGKLE